MEAIFENIRRRRDSMLHRLRKAHPHHLLYSLLTDPRSFEYPLFGSFLSPLAVAAVYLLIVRVIGPAFMKNRPPMQLNKLMVVYNAIQVVLSAYVCHHAFVYAWGGRYNYLCQPFDASHDTYEDRAGIRCTYVYFWTKIVDLLDTLFIVARKNERQLSFLHVYHHALMIIGVWIGFAFSPGGHITFLGQLNSFVHVVMYSYYLLTAWKPEYKSSIWWKKHITQLQLAQFVLIAIHAALPLVQPNCNVSIWLTLLILSQALFMIRLFWGFYSKAYLSGSANGSKSHKKVQ